MTDTRANGIFDGIDYGTAATNFDRSLDLSASKQSQVQV
jgi:hypothetical protein